MIISTSIHTKTKLLSKLMLIIQVPETEDLIQ